MDKKTYYVSMQGNTIMENQGDSSYEFEIEATEEDIRQIQELFDEKLDAEDSSFFRAITPAIPHHIDDESGEMDYWLLQAYRKLHELGTPETRAHIESMNILQLNSLSDRGEH